MTPTTATTAQMTVGPAGAIMAVAGYSVSIPPAALTGQENVTLTVTTDPGLAARYFEASWVLSPDAVQSSTELHISLSQNLLAAGATIAVTAVPTADILSVSNGGAGLSLGFLNVYTSEDPDTDEQIDSLHGVDISFNAASSSISGSIPTNAFAPVSAGGGEAILKVFAEPSPTVFPALLSTMAQTSATSGTKGWHGCTFPVESVSDSSTFYDPLGGAILQIVGPFGERFGHKKLFHDGTDFIANIGSMVYAPRSGYIERIGNVAGSGGQYVVVRHADGTVTKFMHLTPGSIRNAGKVITVDSTNTSVSQAFWTSFMNKAQAQRECQNPSFPVAAKELVALSGTSGTIHPHLHFEWGAEVSKDGYRSLSPISLLGKAALALPGKSLDTSTQLQLSINEASKDALVEASLIDTNNNEIVVRRHKASPDVYLPVTAQGSNLDVNTSDTPIVTTGWNFNDLSIGGTITSSSQVYPVYAPNTQSLLTDSGNVNIRASSIPATETTVDAAVIITPIGGPVQALQQKLNITLTPKPFGAYLSFGVNSAAIAYTTSIPLIHVIANSVDLGTFTYLQLYGTKYVEVCGAKNGWPTTINWTFFPTLGTVSGLYSWGYYNFNSGIGGVTGDTSQSRTVAYTAGCGGSCAVVDPARVVNVCP